MKRILVPVDFSKEAKVAAKVAARIAKLTNSDIYLLHMLELPSGVIDSGNFGGTSNAPTSLLFVKRAHEKFVRFKKQHFLAGINVIEIVQFNKAFEGILEETEKQNIDLIVMGSKGVSGIEEILIGSNTEKVVRRSDVPVLVVKEAPDDFKIDDIVFASNFHIENRNTFQKIIDFATFFDANLHLLKVNTIHNFETTKKTSELIRAFVNEFDIGNHTLNIYNDITIEKGILNFSNDIGADLIAINTHGRRGLAHLFNGSIGEDIANKALKPVITFKLVK
ncbi:MAG: universal stress protein [Flavobacteriaceae bacterium]|nr:universal stress protein [Flavobacteriaceae bacterium]